MSGFNDSLIQKADALLQPGRKIYYFEILDTILVLGVIVSTLTYYLIFAHSPKEMHFYRYYLINFTTWNAVLCLTNTVLFRSDWLVSVNCSIVRGLLASAGNLVIHIFVALNAVLYSNIGTSVAVCIFYKYMVLSATYQLMEQRLGKWAMAIISIGAHLVTIAIVGECFVNKGGVKSRILGYEIGGTRLLLGELILGFRYILEVLLSCKIKLFGLYEVGLSWIHPVAHFRGGGKIF